MQYRVRGGNQLIKALSSVVYDLPAPSNLSYFWNFGAILGRFLVMQILRGFLLVIHYTPDVGTAFSSVIIIIRDVNYGWLMRRVHANGASFFFFFYIYILDVGCTISLFLYLILEILGLLFF